MDDTNEPNIAMFRLITGEDVVTQYEVSVFNNSTKYTFIHPTKFITRRYSTGQIGISLTPWLPNEVLLQGIPNVVIADRDILTIIQIRDKLREFYIIYVEDNSATLAKHDKILDDHLSGLIKHFKTNNILPEDDIFPDTDTTH